MALDTRIPCIKDAFHSLEEGMSKDYDALLHRLSNPELEDEYLTTSLEELQECLRELGKEKEILVGILLKIRWTDRSPKAIRQYQRLILGLLSAHTFYVKAALNMIIRQFMPAGASGEDVTEEKRTADNACFLHLHTLLKAILQIIPMAPVVLMPLLTEKFPYYTKPCYTQECYVRNLLQLTFYLPRYRDKILELIIDRMTKLDVRSPREEIQEAEEDSDDEDEMDIFEMDGVPGAPEVKPKNKKVHKDAEKLDVLMEQLLNHVKETCCPKGELDWPATRDLYRQLLNVFGKILLPTHASCHVQYVMFYICSLRNALSEDFLDYLWKKVQDPNTQSIFRQAAVAYVESLVARATFIPVSTVKGVLDLLVPWVHKYIQETAEINTRADVKRHGPFYSVCQAIFYILVFRHKELLSTHNGLKYCQSLNLQTIVTCRLNPLRFCLPTVVTTFASIARQHQIAFCDTIMEKNKRSLVPEAGSHSNQISRLTQLNPLDSFFPFDPYLLERSSVFIHPLYREYEGAPVTETDNLSEDDEEEDHYMDVGSYTEGSKVMGFSLSSSAGCMAKSPGSPSCVDFLLHGTSPGFKQP